MPTLTLPKPHPAQQQVIDGSKRCLARVTRSRPRNGQQRAAPLAPQHERRSAVAASPTDPRERLALLHPRRIGRFLGRIETRQNLHRQQMPLRINPRRRA
jgi:hypothetical protein